MVVRSFRFMVFVMEVGISSESVCLVALQEKTSGDKLWGSISRNIYTADFYFIFVHSFTQHLCCLSVFFVFRVRYCAACACLFWLQKRLQGLEYPAVLCLKHCSYCSVCAGIRRPPGHNWAESTSVGWQFPGTVKGRWTHFTLLLD